MPSSPGPSAKHAPPPASASRSRHHHRSRARPRHAAEDGRLAAEIEGLAAHLARFPYLGLGHPVGERIAAAVAQAPKVTLDAAEWHRARLPEGPERYDPADLGPPPATRAEGRFNHYGQTVFYLASTRPGACAETAEARRAIIWVQRWRVRRFRGLLDLAGAVGPAGRGVEAALLTAGLNAVFRRHRPDPDSPWKPEYFVPRFVADVARAAGFRGILSCSTRFDGYNAVLFAWTRREIAPVGEPEIVDFAAPTGAASHAGRRRGQPGGGGALGTGTRLRDAAAVHGRTT